MGGRNQEGEVTGKGEKMTRKDEGRLGQRFLETI